MQYRISVVVLAGVFFCASWWFFSWSHYASLSGSEESSAQARESIGAQTLRNPLADTDGDGLANWEEELYGTSPTRSDSDGDGVDDAQEAREGTDPTIGWVPQPDLVEVLEAPVVRYDFAQEQHPASLEDLSQTVVALGQNRPETIPSDTVFIADHGSVKEELNQIAVVVRSSFALSDQVVAQLPHYGVSQEADPSALRDLQNTFADTARAYTLLLETRHFTELVRSWVERFEQSAHASQENLETIIEHHKMGQFTQETSQAWVGYVQQQEAWVALVIEIHQWISTYGVVFEPSEPGYVFMFAL